MKLRVNIAGMLAVCHINELGPNILACQFSRQKKEIEPPSAKAAKVGTACDRPPSFDNRRRIALSKPTMSHQGTNDLRKRLSKTAFPRASTYDPHWLLENVMGPHVLWLVEWLCQGMTLEPGMRVLDLGCGRATSSVFLAKEFGVTIQCPRVASYGRNGTNCAPLPGQTDSAPRQLAKRKC
jgi:hypothetical protein